MKLPSFQPESFTQEDKNLAEGTVKFTTTQIIDSLRNRKIFSFEEVQCAVAEKLEELNRYPKNRKDADAVLIQAKNRHYGWEK